MAVKRRASRPDWSTLLGVPLALGLVLAGQAIEGGSLASILQLTAAMIVFGGTFGAVLVSFPIGEVGRAFQALKTVVNDRPEPVEATIQEVVRLASRARRQGLIVARERCRATPIRSCASSSLHAVDGAKPQVLRDMMELEIVNREEHDEIPARVFEAAGGYLPTLGILGAVLGLIQTMQHLTEPEHIGGGIAVAFVATVYGVGAANLFFLPIATKLKMKARRGVEAPRADDGRRPRHPGRPQPQLIDEKLRAFVNRAEPTTRLAPRRAA